MPRQARKMSGSSIYHIMIRGNERRKIFLDDEDRARFIDTLQIKIEASKGKLFAFCLMDNHVHILVGEGNETIANIMKRINVSYVIYFNKKYNRIGHLFQDRFKSEVIEDDSYLLEAIRYIHNNPVKAGIISRAADYPWSSYKLYKADSSGFLDKEFVLKMFSENAKKAILLFEEFNEKYGNMQFLEYDERNLEEKRVEAENEARVIINEYLKHRNLTQYNLIANKDIRNELILVLKNKGGFSIRRIAELLEINRGVVQKVAKR
jgi:REP element-mobilizing transposase RayT